MIFLEYLGYISINEIKMSKLFSSFIDKIEHLWIFIKDKFKYYQFEGGISVLAGFLVGYHLVASSTSK